MARVEPYPDWRPKPPYTWGDYFHGSKLGYDHSFTPFGYRPEFAAMDSVKKWSSPATIVAIKQLPMRKLILPELLVHTRWFPMEPMLLALMDHAWDRPASWKVYARLLIARRMKAATDLMAPFDNITDDMQEFILYGGSRKTRKKLLGVIHDVTVIRMEESSVHAMAKFLGSCLGEDPTVALLRPFHWLRYAYATTGFVTPLGMGELQKEMRGQKMDLLDLMKSKMPQSLIDELS